ncbi:hypothetical protein BaRGS_00029827 [Batillaria attramentaria]|uniref:Uncharacterized protein n=1 Tax=Batillaria attramentaria TaxID=370345 RepID=A0ABD0JWI8_9CAEN
MPQFAHAVSTWALAMSGEELLTFTARFLRPHFGPHLPASSRAAQEIGRSHYSRSMADRQLKYGWRNLGQGLVKTQ